MPVRNYIHAPPCVNISQSEQEGKRIFPCLAEGFLHAPHCDLVPKSRLNWPHPQSSFPHTNLAPRLLIRGQSRGQKLKIWKSTTAPMELASRGFADSCSVTAEAQSSFCCLFQTPISSLWARPGLGEAPTSPLSPA